MKRQVAIIGMGWVGASVAISTLVAGIAEELLVSDIRADVAEGEQMDLAQGESFYPAAIVRTASIEEMTDAAVIVVAAGRGGRPEESRLQLLRENAVVASEIGRRLRHCRGMIVIVTNPVDVLTRIVTEASGLPPSRVIGTGTTLDTVRLRHVVGKAIRVDPRSVHAYVVGEHGDSEVVLWSSARVGSSGLRDWPGWRQDDEAGLAEEVKRAAYEIIRRKGATNHAIGLATADLLRCIVRDERRVLTVSRVQDGALGLRGVALSLPTVVGADGGGEVLEPAMSPEEAERLQRSAQVLDAAALAVK